MAMESSLETENLSTKAVEFADLIENGVRTKFLTTIEYICLDFLSCRRYYESKPQWLEHP